MRSNEVVAGIIVLFLLSLTLALLAPHSSSGSSCTYDSMRKIFNNTGIVTLYVVGYGEVEYIVNTNGDIVTVNGVAVGTPIRLRGNNTITIYASGQNVTVEVTSVLCRNYTYMSIDVAKVVLSIMTSLLSFTLSYVYSKLRYKFKNTV